MISEQRHTTSLRRLWVIAGWALVLLLGGCGTRTQDGAGEAAEASTESVPDDDGKVRRDNSNEPVAGQNADRVGIHNDMAALVAPPSNATPCTADNQCASGFCTDGFCCDTRCNNACMACSATKKGSGTDGVCGTIAYDTDPDNECANGSCSGSGTCQFYNGYACTATAQCLSTYCVDGFCCGNICTGSCKSCSAAKKGSGSNGVCGAIANGTDPDNECNPGECNGAGTCNQAQPLLANGAACTQGAQCSSGFCVDGVCCNTACSGGCQACSAAKKGSGTDGTCGSIKYDADPDNECANGSCSGSGTCQLYNGYACTTASQCLSSYCVDGFCCGATCSGSCMSCSAAKKGSGSNGVCGTIANGSDPDNECNPGECNGSGACNQSPVLLANGAACTQGTQCVSTFCVDGVCCDTACTGGCQACTAMKKGSGTTGTCGNIKYDTDPDNECANGSCSGTGTCQLYNGYGCTTTSQCLSNYCVDGYCCGNSCTGSCMACSAAKKGNGSNGVCGTIASGTDPDNECNAGDCNGTGACTQPPVLLGNGAACTQGGQCISGFCVDGVCCDTGCTGGCQACTTAKKGNGANGTCGNIMYDTDPDNECLNGACSGSGTCQYYNGLECTTTNECLSNYCVDGFCCGNVCTGLCMACSAAKKGVGSDGVCGAIANNVDPDNECKQSCNGAGACQLFSNGTSCTQASECISGNCVDGICCNSACSQSCMACNVAGSLGTCTNVAAAQSDPNGTPPCNGTCDGNGVCQGGPGSPCTSGTQCANRVCDNQVCAAITPANSLAWTTILKTTTGPWGYSMNVERIATSPNGTVSGGGRKVGYFSLGPYALDDCCYSANWEFTFSGAGYPVTLFDTWANTQQDTYTYQYGRIRYENAVASDWSWYSGPAYSSAITLSTPLWSRQFYRTTVSLKAGDGGHVLIGANILQDDQHVLNPVDFGDGVPVSDARLVKYAPDGTVQFNVPSGSLTVGPILDPMGNFYDISRSTTQISIVKQNALGQPSWTRTYAAPVAAGVTPKWAHAFDTTGNMYLAFNFNGSANLGNGSMTATGIHDLGLAKLDTDGNAIWTKHFGTASFDLQAIELDPTGSADLILRASFAGTADFGTGPFTTSPVMAKFDETGTLEWHTPSPTGTFMVRGSAAGAAYVVSVSNDVNLGWGQPLAGTDVLGIVVAKYGPCSDVMQCRPGGVACASNSQCDSGFCVDGVCCDNACTGECQACTAVKKGGGLDGACGPIALNTDPDNECTYSCNGNGACGLVNGFSCTASSQCLSGYCIDGFCCNSSCADPCMACSATKKGSGTNGACGAIAAGTDPDTECGTGRCSGATGCSMGSIGVACTSGNQCASGFCADGICCDAACTGACQSCKASKKGAGSDGTCGNIADGTDPDNECTQGTCNGAGACLTGTLGRPCVVTDDCEWQTYCTEGVCCDSQCSGTCKSCLAARKGAGTNGTCGNVGLGLDPDNECVNGACGGSGTCKSDAGLACSSSGTCLSGYCVDAVCCATACNDTCEACSAAAKGSGVDGICGFASSGTDPHNDCALQCDGSGACVAAPNGSICSDGSQCTSGFCIDGYCCNTACSGTCEACSSVKKGSGSNGQCGFIASGKDPENECPGSCDGSGACAPPTLLTDGSACVGGAQCNSGYCVDGVCCNTSCYETCKACDVPGSIGVCSPHSPGACNVCGGIMTLPSIPAMAPQYGTLTTADFDSDGLIDVAHASSGTVVIMSALGNRMFATRSQTTIGGSAELATADLNSDGAPDLVATNSATAGVSVLLNLGDGSFAPQVDYATSGSPYDVAIADVNGDGILDICVANHDASEGISALLGFGDGTFAPKITSVLSGVAPDSIGAADMTGDGVVDVVVSNTWSTPKSVYVLRGIGNGSFVYHDDFPIANPNDEAWNSKITLGEFNGDGAMDVAVAYDAWYNGVLRVMSNLGGGVLGLAYSATVPMIPASIETGDMDGDGKLDILTTGTDRANGYSISFNGGSGTFTSTFFRTSATSSHAVASDVDLDGDQDVVLSTESGLVPVLNPGNGAFDNDVSKNEDRSLKLVDLNGDGKRDVVRTNGGLGVQLNQGNNTFGVNTTYGTATMVEVVDVNGDNKPDLLTPNPSANTVEVRLNNGSGAFGAATGYATGSGPAYVAAADITGDGKPDLAVANTTGNTMSILRNNGNGTFAAKVDYATAASPRKIVPADMNGDNILDLVVGADGNRDIDVAYNQGTGTFVLANFANATSNPTDYVVKDFTGDGKADFAIFDGAYPNYVIAVKTNQGGNTFSAPITYPLTHISYSPDPALEARDVEGDGKTDLCLYFTTTASFGMLSGTMSVLFNYGNGAFGSQSDYLTWSRSSADFNNDGLLDFVRADTTTATIKYGACLP